MRRHLMKTSGKKLPAWFTEHIICWYSPVRQGCTNESLMSDPTLVDLSGKGNDAEIKNFLTSTDAQGNYFGACSDGSIQFASSSWAECKTSFALTDFTIIMDRDLSMSSINTPSRISAGKSKNPSSYEFIFEQIGNGSAVYSFGSGTNVAIKRARNISVMTPTTYNGTAIHRGNNIGAEDSIVTINNIRPEDTNNKAQIRLYSFFIFDASLTNEQVQWVKDNLTN